MILPPGRMLGAPGRQAWSEIWDTIGPLLESAMHGNATWNEDLQFFFARNLPEVYSVEVAELEA